MLTTYQVRGGDVRALAGAVVFGSVVGLLIGGSYLGGASARQVLAGREKPMPVRLADQATTFTTTQVAAGQGGALPVSLTSLHGAGIAQAAQTHTVLTLRDRFRLALNVTQTVAQPFHFRDETSHTAAAHSTDANCLAQAVYYEARGESASGQAAVAQVVLNRVRHPAFPKTVCGVVFQKSGQGCQFSFTCNGSMHNGLEPGAWHKAQQVAQRALSGSVMAGVGEATQFQAVRAGWANGLLKVAQIGEHVFYRFAGHQGSAGMFHDRAEPSVAPHAVTSADVRVAALSASQMKMTQASQAPAASPAELGTTQTASSTSVSALTASSVVAPIAAKASVEPAAVKTTAPVVTSVKADDDAAKPMTVAAAGA